MTMRPRASEVMKLGSPVKTSRDEAGVGLGAAGGAGGREESDDARVWRGVRLMRVPFRDVIERKCSIDGLSLR